jgi:hypothetical protein
VALNAVRAGGDVEVQTFDPALAYHTERRLVSPFSQCYLVQRPPTGLIGCACEFSTLAKEHIAIYLHLRLRGSEQRGHRTGQALSRVSSHIRPISPFLPG